MRTLLRIRGGEQPGFFVIREVCHRLFGQMGMGMRVNHAWGMTETSPIGTMGAPSPDWDDLSFDAQLDPDSQRIESTLSFTCDPARVDELWALAQQTLAGLKVDEQWLLAERRELVRQRLPLEIIVDDQDFTQEWLRSGQVLGCVTTLKQALRGCKMVPLGAMHYVAVASASYAEQHLPHGLTPHNFRDVSFLSFNRKDDMAAEFVARTFGLKRVALNHLFVPSTEGQMRAVSAGWGVGVMPERAFGLLHTGAALRSVPLTDAWAQRQLVLVARDFSSLPATARLLVDHLTADTAVLAA